MRLVLLVSMLGLLAACGGSSRGQVAADTCMREVGSRLADKRIDVDVARLAASANEVAPDTLQLSAPIVFDRGTDGEYTQTIQCRVRFDAEQPSLLFLQFDWDVGDIRKSQ